MYLVVVQLGLLSVGPDLSDPIVDDGLPDAPAQVDRHAPPDQVLHVHRDQHWPRSKTQTLATTKLAARFADTTKKIIIICIYLLYKVHYLFS